MTQPARQALANPLMKLENSMRMPPLSQQAARSVGRAHALLRSAPRAEGQGAPDRVLGLLHGLRADARSPVGGDRGDRSSRRGRLWLRLCACQLTSLDAQAVAYRRNIVRLRAEAYPALPFGRSESGAAYGFGVLQVCSGCPNRTLTRWSSCPGGSCKKVSRESSLAAAAPSTSPASIRAGALGSR